MLILVPNFLQAGVAPCFTAMARLIRKQVCELVKLWCSTTIDYEAKFMTALGMSVKDHEKHILTSGWGGLCEISLYCRPLGVQVICVRTSDCKRGVKAAEVCTLSCIFRPQAPQLAILAVNVNQQHWDLGLVSDGKFGWTALFPIHSWQEHCQKIIDFLASEKKRPMWTFALRPGCCIHTLHSHMN